MPILTLLIYIALIGFGVWLLTTYVPMADSIKKLIVIAAVVLVVLWILQLIGFTGPAVPRVFR